MSVKMRQEVEQKIASAVITAAIAAGYTMSVDYGAGESKVLRSHKTVMAAMFQGDEDRVYMRKDGKNLGWVYFVYGNDGWDVVSDYTVNLEHIMGPAMKISDHYADYWLTPVSHGGHMRKLIPQHRLYRSAWLQHADRPYRSPYRKFWGIAVSDWKFFGASLLAFFVTMLICWAWFILGPQ